MRPRIQSIALAAILGTTMVAVSLAALTKSQNIAVDQAPPVSSKTPLQPKPSATPALSPLQIEAIRARTYPGSPITTVRTLPDAAGVGDNLVQFTADGLTEYARVTTPAGSPSVSGWPVIILLHGYVNPADWSSTGDDYLSIMEALSQHGYVVFRPDYRGHGMSAGTPAGGHFAPDYAYDTLNLVASLKHYQSINPARIGLLGHSLGGHTALRVAVTSSDIQATAFMNGVVGSFYDIFYNWPHSPAPGDQPAAVVQGARQKLVAQYGDPKTNPTFWDSASAVNYVRYITGAVQIDQDVGDSTVPKLFADHLDAALKAAGKSADYEQYPGDDHQMTANRAAFLQHLLVFYEQHL